MYLTRYGNTNFNELGLCNDDPDVDVHVAALGISQVEQAALILKDEKIELVIVSLLRRTRQTADIINKFHDPPIEVDSRISDIRNGFEGRPVSNYASARSNAINPWEFNVTDAESVLDVCVRVTEFLGDLRLKPQASVRVVSHQMIIRQLVSILDGYSRVQTNEFDLVQGNYLSFEI